MPVGGVFPVFAYDYLSTALFRYKSLCDWLMIWRSTDLILKNLALNPQDWHYLRDDRYIPERKRHLQLI